MSSYPSSWLRFFVGYAVLFLFVGCVAIAQQPNGDKSKTDIPKAGVSGVSTPTCEYCPDPSYSQEARKKKFDGVVVLTVVVTTEGQGNRYPGYQESGVGFG